LDPAKLWCRHLVAKGCCRARGNTIAAAAVPGVDRLLWGSDWPHTQHESIAGYDTVLAQLEKWLPDAHDRAQVMTENPRRLFRL